jgi:hypothetical protein
MHSDSAAPKPVQPLLWHATTQQFKARLAQLTIHNNAQSAVCGQAICPRCLRQADHAVT